MFSTRLCLDGTTYRSITEALWASYFSERSVVFEYERSIKLHYNGTYKPDFFLPAHNLYIEIKGFGKQLSTKEMGKIVELSMTGAKIYCISGTPLNHKFFLMINGQTFPGGQHLCFSPDQIVRVSFSSRWLHDYQCKLEAERRIMEMLPDEEYYEDERGGACHDVVFELPPIG